MPITRRKLVIAAAAVGVPFGGCKAASEEKPKETIEIDIAGYDRILLPREHGQLSNSKDRVVRRYPSRDHCMQMAAFFGQSRGLLVYTTDTTSEVSDWEVIPGRVLRIHFFSRVPGIIRQQIEPTIEAAAAGYRVWARQQSWVRQRTRTTKPQGFISVASNPDIPGQRRHLMTVRGLVDGPIGAWFTQWRRFPFDSMYPDYVPGDPRRFAVLLSELRKSGWSTFPYVNGLLWDERFEEFKSTGVRAAIRSAENTRVSYNSSLNFLNYACPHAPEWKDKISDACSSIRDADGLVSGGVYLDMLLAANPILCWSADHGHEPGDPGSWLRGVRSILRGFSGEILVEGCAEPYLDLVDYPLMHLYTQKLDSVPLWSMVYGDLVGPVGWTLPSKLHKGDLSAQVTEAARYGVRGLGSPWMTATPEAELLGPAVVRELRGRQLSSQGGSPAR